MTALVGFVIGFACGLFFGWFGLAWLQSRHLTKTVRDE